jgi:polysaccharide chain length determinant protein (PEP-CTERM system associated)
MLQFTFAMSGPAPLEILGLLMKEGRRRMLLVSGLFSAVALVALFVGMSMPKKWEASATLLAEDSNIIKPLMDGRAVTTNAGDQTAVVTQIVLSRRIMKEVLEFGGWLSPPPAPQPDPRALEQTVTRLRSHVRIDSPRDGLIRIGFTDSDQHRVYKVANRLAEIYVREANDSKERESREAFDFIDAQAKEYGDKLTEVHQKVLAYYKGLEAPAVVNVVDPEQPVRPKGSIEQLASLRAEEATLVAQLEKLHAPIKTNAVQAQTEERARARVQDLQAQLDRLQVSYTDDHPDVRRLKKELEGAQDALARAEEAAHGREKMAEATSALDSEMTAAARGQLESVRAKIAALGGRTPRHHSSSAAVAAAELRVDPDMRGVGQDAKLSELLRQYESTRDIYQDLLKRRENARVSMVLDAEGRGLALRVQEAAEMPVIPSSLRLMHLTMIGLVLAAMIPIGLLFAIVSLDRRVRDPQQITRAARVPLLVSINYSPARRQMSRDRKRKLLAAAMIGGTFAVYVAVFIIKLKTS